MPLAIAIITFVFALRASALFLAPVLKSAIVWMKYDDRQSRDSGVFRTPLAVRVVAERAGAHVRPAAVRHDFGHPADGPLETSRPARTRCGFRPAGRRPCCRAPAAGSGPARVAARREAPPQQAAEWQRHLPTRSRRPTVEAPRSPRRAARLPGPPRVRRPRGREHCASVPPVDGDLLTFCRQDFTTLWTIPSR